jgi:hypothetical protein
LKLTYAFKKLATGRWLGSFEQHEEAAKPARGKD